MNTWPLPALLTWAAAWAVHRGLLAVGVAPLAALLLPLLGGLAAAAWCRRRAGHSLWRQAMLAGGFPLAWLLLQAGRGDGAWPAWAWLLPLAALLVIYPLHAWADAPLFPTPPRALEGLGERLVLPAQACVVDAGCGLGDGLAALARELPQARLQGWEWSWPLTLACRWRLRHLGPRLQVQRQDIWRAPWGPADVVYLFQRPESMPRAQAKAAAEMRPGSWLVSLEFEAPGWTPSARLETVPGKPVWLYQAPFQALSGQARSKIAAMP